MNFIEEFKKGQAGGNQGLSLGEGLKQLDATLNGLQRRRIYAVASAPKVGKTTLIDYGFVIQPYLDAMRKQLKLDVDYFSFEIDRVSKEFDFAAYFLWQDHMMESVELPEGVTRAGEKRIPINPDYLRGRLLDDNGKTILIDYNVYLRLKEVYNNRIIPLFGEFDAKGKQLKPGVIRVIEHRNNPTGIYKYLWEKAEREGEFVREGGEHNGRITGYIPKDEEKFTLIVTDHLRKLIPERNFTLKQTVDKYLEYSVELRNLCGYTFVHIIHLNRNLTSTERLKLFDDQLYPNGDDVKESGNVSEDCDYLLTLFNPNDERYNLTRYFGIPIKGKGGEELYPNLRTIHLVESRHCAYPRHFAVNMFGESKRFEKCNLKG